MKGTINLVKDAVISISMISRAAANLFATRPVRHRPTTCEFSRGQLDDWPRRRTQKNKKKHGMGPDITPGLHRLHLPVQCRAE